MYSLKEVYEALVAGLGKPFAATPAPHLAETWGPICAGSLAHEEITRRGILPIPKLAQSPDGHQILFLNDRGEVQVYRTPVGYRTVGRDKLWTGERIPRDKQSTKQNTLVVYGMLDAALLGQLIPEAHVVTPTWGQQHDRKIFAGLPGRLWVLPDRGEENTAIRLLSTIGWRAAGLILMPTLYKDPCEMSESIGPGAVRDLVMEKL